MTEQLSAAQTRAVQTRLANAGYDPHGIDGTFGRQTYAASFSYVAGADLGGIGLSLADGALKAFPEFEIASALRMAHFIGQAAAETGGFRTFVENLNYSAAGLLATFPTHYTPALAAQHARNPQVIANHVYANRTGNGSEASGDGWRYRGRGPTMLTFRGNAASVGSALGIDLEGNPDLAADPEHGVRIMARYWQIKGLNAYADSDRCLAVSRGINLGNPLSTATPNGLADRQRYTARAKGVLGCV